MNPELNNIDGKKNALVLLVGPPASGKSTWGKDFAEKNGAVYVSTDSIRAEIGTGEGDQTVSGAAFGIAKNRISRALSGGKNAVIDATNVNRKSRKDWIDIAQQNNAYTIAVAFEVPREELYRRDAQRERHVGNEIIDRFVDKYARPTVGEVDKVIVK
jgi:predicted kinase